MKLCKECKRKLDSNNTFTKDKRYCISCGQKHHDFLIGRRLVLYTFRSLPLHVKIRKTQMLIDEAVSEFGLEHCYISYSGGKDSTVLSHIARKTYPHILHIFANTTNEYPETIHHVIWEKEHNNMNLIIVTPVDAKGELWTFKKVVERYGYPMFSKSVSNAIRTRRHACTDATKQHSDDYIHRKFKKYEPYKNFNISDKCCDKLKKEPLKRKAKELNMNCAILGILASESYQREKDWLENGCNIFHIMKDNQCRPLSFWQQRDIDEYIETYNIKISSLYKKGYSRNGCMYCGFGIHLEKGINRFQKLAVTHPIQHDYLVRNFGGFLIELGISF